MNDITRVYELITEAEALSFKIVKLENFITSDKFNNIPSVQQHLLTKQYDIMRDYLTVLLRRLYYMNEGKVDEM